MPAYQMHLPNCAQSPPCRYKRYKASTATNIDVARHIAFCHDFQYEVTLASSPASAIGLPGEVGAHHKMLTESGGTFVDAGAGYRTPPRRWENPVDQRPEG